MYEVYDGEYSKDFTLEFLPKDIKKLICDYGEKVLKEKNRISEIIAENLSLYSSMKQLEFVTYANNYLDVELDSSTVTDALKTVYDSYTGKFKQINRNMKRTCVLKKIKNITYYKKNDYKRNILKGDIKKIVYQKYYTPMTNLLALMCVFDPRKHKSQYEGLDFRSALLKYIAYKTGVIAGDIRDISYSILSLTDENEKVRLEHKLEEKENDFKMFIAYRRIVNDDQKYTRLYSLKEDKQKRIYNKYNTPCVFEKLSFTLRIRKKDLISEFSLPEECYENYKGKMRVNACINVGNSLQAVGLKDYVIPTIFDRKYHGNISDYNTKDGNYRVRFIIPNKNDDAAMRMSFTVTDKRCQPSGALERTGIVGGDLNIKRNQFVFSDGFQTDWNRKLLNELAKIIYKIDNLRNQMNELKTLMEETSKDISAGRVANIKEEKRKQRKRIVVYKDLSNRVSQLTAKRDKLKRQIDDDNVRNVVKSLNHFNDSFGKGNVHIALENLDSQFSKDKKIKYVTPDGIKISQNRLFRECGFGHLKDLYVSIGSKEKYDVLVTKTHAAHSSRFCLDCGFISEKNRKVQETFDCIKCHFTMDADFKSAIFLQLTVTVPSIRDALFDYDEQKRTLTLKKNLTKDKVLKIYEKFGLDIVNAYHALTESSSNSLK